MFSIKGKLTNPDNASYAAHSVAATYNQQVTSPDAKTPITQAGETRVPVHDDGAFTLDLPDKKNLTGAVTFQALAPNGATLATREIKADDVPQELIIAVKPQAGFELQPLDDPFLGKKVKLTGLVLDSAGKRQVAHTQVIFWARAQDGEEPAVVLATRTDSRGYFSGDYPHGEFVEAFGVVSLDKNQTAPVRLQEDKTFPLRVVLVVEVSQDIADGDGAVPRNPDSFDLANSPETYSADIGGRCVDFTVPNRTLEEFSYYSIVRTTDPVIKGLTLDEPSRRIPSRLLEAILDKYPAQALAAGAAAGEPVTVAAPAVAVRARAAAPKNNLTLSPDTVKLLASDPDNFTPQTLMTAAKLTAFRDVVGLLDVYKKAVPGRGSLTADNPVDWDDEPTFYQSTTIAHGHILHFKQVWRADGYSLGDLLYSLPLAPCQKKQIAVIDWERRETGFRSENLLENEQMAASLSRDRDISEIVNTSFDERVRGGSEANTWAAGGGLGLAIGPLVLGAAGGGGGASSSAWQNSSRNLSANSLNQLRDRVLQSASAVRSQRATVIQTVTQGETMRVQTEVVANHNHCHAMTIEYFEVLRHFALSHELADVQECLFVPLLMSRFDMNKVLRWREALGRFLRDRRLAGGFDALDRIKHAYEGSDLPLGRYADDRLENLEGELRMSFQLVRPQDNTDGSFNLANWNLFAPFLGILGGPLAVFNQFFLDQVQAERDRRWQAEVAPRIAEAFVQTFRFYLVTNTSTQQVPLDATLVSSFAPNAPLYVSLRPRGAVPNLTRADVTYFEIRSTEALPQYSKVIVHWGSVRYRTAHASDFLFRDYNIANDLKMGDPARIYTPLNRQELRNPREEDKEIARKLLAHLTENIEYYHRAIWWTMDGERRYMLLDGFVAPNASGRSVASVVENRLIGIVGNCLVLPVAPGFQLDPTIAKARQEAEENELPLDLLNLYAPLSPVPPTRISVPTRGVFAEAVMGACNSCERKDETRFWRWEESPCGDEPTAIEPVSTESRRGEPPDLTAKDFPTPMINIQNAPNAPDPTGLAAALQLIGTPNIFKDITGLEGNQRNALAAFQAALDASKFFGGEASKLALQSRMNRDIDKALGKINESRQSGAITEDQARSLTEAALRGLIGGGTTNEASPISTGEINELANTAGANDANVSVSRPSGERVQVDARREAGLEDASARTLIILPTARNTPDARAFLPSRQDKSGAIELEATVRNAPAGATFLWSRPDPASLTITSPGSARTVVQGMRPGPTDIDFAVHDSSGAALASVKLRLSVPQFVTIDQDAAAFDGVLAAIHLDVVKDDVLREARSVCDHLLRTSNVRTVWRVAPFAEALPAHLPAANVTALTIRGEPPAGQPNLLGRTNLVGGAGGAAVLNETIDLFPGAYDNPVAGGGDTDVDVETQALILQLESQTFTDPALEQFAVKVYGRLLGETMAHEIVHSLLAFDIPSGHNSPAIPNDLMNNGSDRAFRQRTGIEDTAHTSPVDPNNFVDHGLAAIGGLQATNQGLMDARFPVPPSFR